MWRRRRWLALVAAARGRVRPTRELAVAVPLLVLCGCSRPRSRAGSAARPPRDAGRAAQRHRAQTLPGGGAPRPGASSRPSSAPRTTPCRPTTSRRTPRPVVAHRTSPTNIGLYLLSTVAARDFGWIGTLDAGRAARGDPRDDRRTGALPRTLLQLVRHARPAAARAAVRVDRRQRQPRRPSDALSQVAAARARPQPDRRRGDPARHRGCARPRRARRLPSSRARRSTSSRTALALAPPTIARLAEPSVASSRRPSEGSANGRTRWTPTRQPASLMLARRSRRRRSPSDQHDLDALAPWIEGLDSLAPGSTSRSARRRRRRAAARRAAPALRPSRISHARRPASWPAVSLDRDRGASTVEALEESARAAEELLKSLADVARSAPRAVRQRWTSRSCSTSTRSCSPSAIASPTARSTELLRPAGLRGAARRASWRSPRATCRPTHWFHLGRPMTPVESRLGAHLVVGLDVRVPDAGARHARARRQPARADVPARGAPPDPYAASAACPGHLGVGLQRARPRPTYQYSSFGVPGLGLKRGLERRPGGRALRDRAGGDGRSAAAAREPRAARAATAASGPYGFYEALDYTAERLAGGRARRGRCAPTWPTTRG